MCGIAGIHRLSDRPFPELDRFAAALLDGIEERGQDATGFAAVNDIGDVQLQKASCRAYYFNQHRGQIASDARTVLLHTRLATQGKPAFPENNHPVMSGDVYCVHNGHVSNDGELFKLAERARIGQVDSEAIPALIASMGWVNRKKALESVEGAFAVALWSLKHPGELTLAKGDWSPLVYVQTEHLLVWASTWTAIQKAWEKVLGTPPGYGRTQYMQPGDILNVSARAVSKDRFKVNRPKIVYVSAPKKVKAPRNILARYDWTEDGELAETPAPLELPAGVEEEDATNVPGEEGWDILRCEDCYDWYDADELGTVEVVGITSLLCPACREWACKFADAVEVTREGR